MDGHMFNKQYYAFVRFCVFSCLCMACNPVQNPPSLASEMPAVTDTPVVQASPTVVPTTEPTRTVVPTFTATETATVTPSPIPEKPKKQWKVEATVKPETAFTYVFPVKDAEVTYGRYHHDYPASDIFCAEGSQYVAVVDGIVDFVTFEDVWSPKTNDPVVRGGISIAFVGVDGNRYYGSHLSSIAEGITVGAQVHAGQLLGLTGKSGNARGTPPHVHFGISRPSTADDWEVRRGEMNPFVFLEAWRNGNMLQPLFVEE